MAGGNPAENRTVTTKVLAILEAFEVSRGAMSLTEIAESAGLPLSTAHRLVGELTEWGLLFRGSQGRYQLGIRLWELAQNAWRPLRETARPFIQDLFSLTGETAHLAVREGNEVLYVDRVYGSKRVPRASKVGGRLPMHATAVGKAILAFEESWVRSAYLDRQLEHRTAHTHVDPRLLADELDQIRAQGFATTLEEVRLGSCSIAVPVFHGRQVGAGIGLVMLSSQSASMSRHLPALRGVAAHIEKATAHIPLEGFRGGGSSGA